MDTGAVPVYFMLNGMRFGVRSGSDPFSGTMSWVDMVIGVKEGFEFEIRSTPLAKVAAGKILERTQVPMFVVPFAAQEILHFKNAKSGGFVVEVEDRLEQCHYADVITKTEELS